MGSGQEEVAERALMSAAVNGGWLLLQNCHLSPEFVGKLPELLERTECRSEFRLLLTSEPSQAFPVSMLHIATKVRVFCSK